MWVNQPLSKPTLSYLRERNFDSSLEPSSMATDMGAMDWNYWNDLMLGAESSEMMAYGTQEIYDQGSTLSYPRG
jgi:hypothetical protein